MDFAGQFRCATVRAPLDPYPRALTAWYLAMDDAAEAEAALRRLRERVRASRVLSAENVRRACDALARRQEALAQGFFDAARAQETVAWEGEAELAECERRCAALRERCDELGAVMRREAERHAMIAGAHAVDGEAA